jgi:hypothetical protein
MTNEVTKSRGRPTREEAIIRGLNKSIEANSVWIDG